MTRQRFEGLRNELCRRIWIKEKGTAKGFTLGHKLQDTKAQFDKLPPNLRSYAAIWNSPESKILRQSVGM